MSYIADDRVQHVYVCTCDVCEDDPHYWTDDLY